MGEETWGTLRYIVLANYHTCMYVWWRKMENVPCLRIHFTERVERTFLCDMFQHKCVYWKWYTLLTIYLCVPQYITNLNNFVSKALPNWLNIFDTRAMVTTNDDKNQNSWWKFVILLSMGNMKKEFKNFQVKWLREINIM